MKEEFEHPASVGPDSEGQGAIPLAEEGIPDDWVTTASEECVLATQQQEASDYEAEKRYLEEIARIRARKLRSVAQLIKAPVVQRRFLIGPALLPKQGRMLITGMSGTGKSTLTLYLAACLASKTPLFGILNTHKDENCGQPRFPIADTSAVLYVDYELPEDIRTQERLRPLVDQFPGEFQTNVFFPQHPSLYRLHNQAGEAPDKGSYDALTELLRSVRPDVLIVDPLSSTHSLDENSIAIKQALNNVDRLIDLYGCAAIVVHHSSTKFRVDNHGQPIPKSTIAQPRGHSSLVDWCDVHMHFEAENADDAQDEDDEPTRIITMKFGKARYCLCPNKRKLRVDFRAMRVSAMSKHGTR